MDSIISNATFAIGFDVLKQSVVGDRDNYMSASIHSYLKQDGAQHERNRNMIFSPFTIAETLAIIANGSNNERSQVVSEILKFARFRKDSDGKGSSVSLEEINRAFGSYNKAIGLDRMSSMDRSKTSQILVANGLFGKEIKVDFLKSQRANYHGLDGTTENPRAEKMNEWISKRTRGQISEITRNLQPETNIALVDALCFNGLCTLGFPRDQTSQANFVLADGTTTQVEMMSSHSQRLRYSENDHFQIVDLPLQAPFSSTPIVATILLPTERQGQDALNKMLSAPENDKYSLRNGENWRNWTTQMREDDVQVDLPRIRLDDTLDLVSVLKQTGVQSVFQRGKADLGKMVEGNGNQTAIDVAIHRARVELEESPGTGHGANPKSTSAKKRVTCNRPFLLVIRRTDDASILTIAKVMNPVHRSNQF